MSFSSGAAFWLGFGVRIQEDVSSEIKARLDYVDRPAMRAVGQHLARMHAILEDVSEAVAGGILRKPAKRVWADSVMEVRQLEGLLNQGAADLAQLVDDLGRMGAKTDDLGLQLAAHGRALEFALDRVPNDESVVLSRLSSMTTSQALLHEHREQVQALARQIQEMVSLVLDGVLLKLTAVYALLAAYPTKPTETQRFLATEKLSELTQLLIR